MIISIREAEKNKNHRGRTLTGAVANIVDRAITGEPFIVETVIDLRGRKVKNNNIRMMAARICRARGIEYATETGENGEFIFYRFT